MLQIFHLHLYHLTNQQHHSQYSLNSTETPFSTVSDSPSDSLETPSSPTSSNESSSHQDTQPDSPSAFHQLPQPFLPPSSSTSPCPSVEVPPDRMVTRSQTSHLKPKQYPGFQLFPTIRHPLHALHTCLLPPEPTTFKQAATKPECVNAMNLEYQALISNKTWSLCPRPPHHNVVRNKWVFKIKQKSDGSVDRYKARLVAKGFDQLNGVDYYETFSPVIKPTTIRLVLALAMQFD